MPRVSPHFGRWWQRDPSPVLRAEMEAIVTRLGAPAEFRRRGVERAWRQSVALETALAGAGMVDVLAQATTPFGPWPGLQYRPAYWRGSVT